MNNYIEFTITLDQQKSEMLIAELAEMGYEGFIENENSFSAYIPESEFNQVEFNERLIHYGLNPDEVPRSQIADQNWNEQWEAGYEPIIIDDQIAVLAPFHQLHRTFETEIIIKPKNTFGTGHHETTQLMLKMMQQIDFKEKMVFDFGCGTGVLAIMASGKGANHVFANDIDAWSADNVPENAALNKVSNIEFVQGDLTVANGKSFDIILANINKNILLESFEALAGMLKPNGLLLISGFYASDLSDLENAASKFNLNPLESNVLSNWCASRFIKIK